MIRFLLKERISIWEDENKRRLTLRELATKTGIYRTTLSRISGTVGYNTTTDNIDRLCQFFGCRVQDLMEYVSISLPPDPTNGPEGAQSAER